MIPNPCFPGHESGSFLKAWGSCLSEWWIQHGFDQEYWWSHVITFMGIPLTSLPWFSWSMFHIRETEHVSNLPPWWSLHGVPNMDHHPQVVRLICCALPSLTFEHWFQAARNGESCAKMWFNMVWFQLISTTLECGDLSISRRKLEHGSEPPTSSTGVKKTLRIEGSSS